MKAIGAGVNRGVNLESEPKIDVGSFVQTGLLKQLGSAASQLSEHDFIVIDGLLTHKTLDMLSKVLLMSSIWRDCVNGMSFAAHHDDGLGYGVFRSLASLLASALSPPQRKLRVVKYHAIALKAFEGFRGPLAVGMCKLNFILFDHTI